MSLEPLGMLWNWVFSALCCCKGGGFSFILREQSFGPPILSSMRWAEKIVDPMQSLKVEAAQGNRGTETEPMQSLKGEAAQVNSGY
jgi:hypothetical protein